MNLAVYLPLLASAGVGWVAPAVARRARPGVGAVALAMLALIAAIGSSWALALLAATLIDDVHPGLKAPVPDAVAVLAVVVLTVAAVRLVLTGRRHHRMFREIRDAVLPGAAVVVLAHPRPDAFAVPARWHPRVSRRQPARVVVTEGMLRTLDDHQRRAMFAHERAHLHGGHHRLRAAAEVAAALNPILCTARRTVAYLCERAADERAAAEIGDRHTVAGAVATAALAGLAADRAADVVRRRAADRLGRPATDRVSRPVTLAFDELGVTERVAALGRPMPARRWLIGGAALLVTVAIVVADAHATGECVAIVRSLLAA